MSSGPRFKFKPLKSASISRLTTAALGKLAAPARPVNCPWVMVGDMNSGSVSFGEGISLTGDYLQFYAKNPQTDETVLVRGIGIGTSIGVGLKVPFTDSVDIPGLPGWQSPFFLGPAGSINMGHNLFAGMAQAGSVDAAASLGFDVCALQFMFPIGVPLEFLAPYGLGPILASRTVKLSTLMAGFFLEADASVDANATWYLTSVNVVSSGKRR